MPDWLRFLLLMVAVEVVTHFVRKLLARGEDDFVGKPGVRMKDICHHCPRCHEKSDPSENPPAARRRCVEGGFLCATCTAASHPGGTRDPDFDNG